MNYMVRTYGRVKHTVFDNRVYYKPALKKVVIRTSGVNRTSPKVIERNKMFKEKMPGIILACRGQPWDKFISCVSERAIEELGLPESKTAGMAYSKTPEYRRRFWKHPA